MLEERKRVQRMFDEIIEKIFTSDYRTIFIMAKSLWDSHKVCGKILEVFSEYGVEFTVVSANEFLVNGKRVLAPRRDFNILGFEDYIVFHVSLYNREI